MRSMDAPPHLGPPDARDARLLSFDAAVASDDGRLRLKAHALAAVVAVIPAAMAVYLSVNRRHDVIEGVVLPTGRLPFSLADEWRRYTHEVAAVDPFAGPRVHGSDVTVATLATFPAAESEAYRAYLQDLGFVDRADVYVRASGGVVASIALLRTAGRFELHELAALRHLQRLIEHAHECAAAPVPPATREALRASGLTRREADVAQLVGRGATNAEIARSLHLTQTTVKTHLTRVYGKLGVSSRTQLAIVVGGGAPARLRSERQAAAGA
jgi:DNA-binding CsgD family transcriptional regulator